MRRLGQRAGQTGLLAVLAVAAAAAQPAPEPDGPAGWRITADNLQGFRGGQQYGDLLNVRIWHDTLDVEAFGDRGRWNQTSESFTLIGNVRLTEKTTVATCDSAIYFRARETATLFGNVHAVDGPFEAAGDTAYLDRGRDRVTIVSNASVIDTLGSITAERIDYDRASGIAVCQHDVVAEEFASRSTATGERLVYNRETDLAILTGDPRLVTRSEGTEPMEIDAEELRLYRGGGTAEARRDVRITQGPVAATAELAVLDNASGRAQLTGDPVTWDPDGRIEADTLTVLFARQQVQRIEALGGVRVIQEPTTGPKAGERTYTTGRQATAWFTLGVVDSMVVEGEAVSDYYPSPAGVADGSGVNHCRADVIRLYLVNGQVDRVRLEGQATGRYWFASTADGPGAPTEGAPAAADTVDAPPATPAEPPREGGPPGDGTEAAPKKDLGETVVPGSDAYPRTEPGPGGDPQLLASLGGPVPGGDTGEDDVLLAYMDSGSLQVLAMADAAAAKGEVDTVDISPAYSVGVLKMSSFLEPAADTTAVFDSTQADSLAWADRIQDLSSVSPPDSLFPGGSDEVTYGGEAVEFELGTQSLRLQQEASVQYHDAWLRAGQVEFDMNNQAIEASDNPRITDPGGDVFGERMDYDVEQREGVVYEARTQFEGGYYTGQRVKKLQGQTLLGQGCTYTTCDQAHPHFHFKAPQMRIDLKKQVVGRPVVLYIADIPTIPLPFFAFPLGRGRQSGFMRPEIEIGISSDRGRFVRNLGYYLAISDYADAKLWLNVFEKRPRWETRGQFRYNKRNAYNGTVFGSAALDYPDRAAFPSTGQPPSQSWQLQARHDQKLGQSASFKVNANFISSLDYQLSQQIGTSFEQQTNRIMESDASFNKSWSGAAVTVAARRRQDLEPEPDEIEVLMTLPQVTFNLSSRPIGRQAVGRQRGFLPFLSSTTWGYSASAVQPVEQFADSTYRETALQQNFSLNDNRKVGAINISPRFQYSWFLFENLNNGDHWGTAARWSAAATATTTLYGDLLFGVGPLLGFRHVLTPSVSFSYVPAIDAATYTDDEGNEQSLYPSVGGISFGGSQRSRFMTLSAANRFQAKVRSGEEVKTVNQLANWNLSTSYNLESRVRPWGPLSSSIQVRPHSNFNLNATMSHDVYEWHMNSLNVSYNFSLRGSTPGALPAGTEFVYRRELVLGETNGLVAPPEAALGGQPWSLNLSQSYTWGRGSDWSSTMRASLRMSFTPKWSATYSVNYNVREGEFTNQDFSLTRDLHCWFAEFQRRFNNVAATYYFKIGVRDIQDIFYQTRG